MDKSGYIKWLRKKWAEYDRRMEDHTSQKEFATFMKTGDKYFSQLFSGIKENPSLELVMGWFDATGDPEIFDYTYPERKPREVDFDTYLSSLPEDKRPLFFKAILDADSMAREKGIDINSPEGKALLSDVMHSAGL